MKWIRRRESLRSSLGAVEVPQDSSALRFLSLSRYFHRFSECAVLLTSFMATLPPFCPSPSPSKTRMTLTRDNGPRSATAALDLRPKKKNVLPPIWPSNLRLLIRRTTLPPPEAREHVWGLKKPMFPEIDSHQGKKTRAIDRKIHSGGLRIFHSL